MAIRCIKNALDVEISVFINIILDLTTFIMEIFFDLVHSFDCGETTAFDLNDCLAFSCYPIVKEYAPEGALFDKVVKKSQEKTLLNVVTEKLRFYQICL